MNPEPPTRPRRLAAGDRVAVIAPCSPCPREALDAGLAVLRGWGLEVVLAPHALDRHDRLGYLAGSDADRAADFQAAWLDPAIAALMCARGGDGAHRTVDLLDFDAMRSAGPKVFTGFSDITVFHEALSVELGAATLHAPVIAAKEFSQDAATAESLRRTLFEPESVRTLTGPVAEALVPGRAHGTTVGGNLSLLNDSLATPHSRSHAEGAILLLEDIGEDVSRLDRMLTQLRRSQWLEGVAGVALGSWQGCTPGLAAIGDLMLDRLGDLGVPVLWELGFGHGPSQLTVPLGVPATLDADAATLTLDVPALR